MVFTPLCQSGGKEYSSEIIVGNNVYFGTKDRIAAMNSVTIEDDVLLQHLFILWIILTNIGMLACLSESNRYLAKYLPRYSVVAGNSARVVSTYDFDEGC